MGVAALHGAGHVSSIPPAYKLLSIISFDSAASYVRDVFLKPMIILLTAFMVAAALKNAQRPQRYLIPLFISTLILPMVVLGYVAISGASLTALSSAHARNFLSAIGL